MQFILPLKPGNWLRRDFREVRALGVEGNVARFRNEFRDLYDAAFPVARGKKSRRDVEKPWLDEPEFKELVREKEVLYSRKIRGQQQVGDGDRLAEVNREVNRTRRRLNRRKSVTWSAVPYAPLVSLIFINLEVE